MAAATRIMSRRATITTIMTDTAALQRLLTWASPAFPVGSFAYSGGLETVIVERRVANAHQVRDWLDGNLRAGGVRNDAILSTLAHRAHGDSARLHALCELALALTSSAQRRDETLTTGDAFLLAARAWPANVPDLLPRPCPYPVAFGAVAGAFAIARRDTLIALLTSYTQAQISVAVRLIPLGQTDGLSILASLEPLVAQSAEALANAQESDLGAASYASDIAAMRHETLHSRIFRS